MSNRNTYVPVDRNHPFGPRMIPWLIALTGAFVLALAVADIAATKFVIIAGIVTPAGSILFSVIFVVRDALHRLAGSRYVQLTILIAAGLNLLMAAFFWWLTKLPAPDFFTLAEPWNLIFALAPGIVIGSVVAATISQLVNTWVFQRLWDRGNPLWWRVIGSNLVSLPIDSIIFTTLAFVILPPLFGAQPIDIATAALRVASGQTIFKFIIMLMMTPLVYLVPERRV